MKNLYEDQAKGLRKEFVNSDTKIISVLSGKGGVGKSIFAVNIAAKLASYNKKILLFDSDAGFANASILLGSNVKYTLSDYMKGKVDFSECVQETAYGIKIISTGFDFNDWKIFQNSFNNGIFDEFLIVSKEIDYLIIDVGAGYSEKLNNFYLNSDKIFLVTIPEPTAVVNAYSLLKALSFLGVKSEIDIVLNMVKDKEEVENVKSVLGETVKRFLNRNIEEFYEISYDSNVHISVKSQVPLVYLKENSKFSKDLKKIADSILNIKTINENSNFSKRLKKIFGIEN